jgi:hypothetical protein
VPVGAVIVLFQLLERDAARATRNRSGGGGVQAGVRASSPIIGVDRIGPALVPIVFHLAPRLLPAAQRSHTGMSQMPPLHQENVIL